MTRSTTIDTPLPTGALPPAQQVVFVFDDLPDWQTLAAAAPEGAEVVVLDGTKDGLDQIAAHLQGRSGIEALHILSHGEAGRVQLGSSSVGADEVQARSELLSRIGDSLTADGDILLYGCNIGATGQGEPLLQSLAYATRADIAASDNLTGSAGKGGDWVLEWTSGSVSFANALNGEALRDYEAVLAAATIEFGDRGFAPEQNLNAVNHSALTKTFNIFTSDLSGVIDAAHPLRYNRADGTGPWAGTWYPTEMPTAGANDGVANASGDGVDQYKVPVALTFKTADGSEFAFIGFNAEQLDYGLFSNYGAFLTVDAYRDGTKVGTENVYANSNSPDWYSTITMSAPAFQNVDEIRVYLDAANTPAWDPTQPGLHLQFDRFVVDNAPSPTLTSATFNDSALKIGDTATVTFVFSTAVNNFDTTDLTVSNGAVTGLSSSDGGITWTGTLTPDTGVASATNVISVNLAGVTSVSGGIAGTGTADSSNYAIDTAAPSVTGVNASTADGTYRVGDTIAIQVSFNESITVTGLPQLTLETGSTDQVATYATGSGSSTLVFNYTVQAGDTTLDLDYLAANALALNGGTLRDAAGNDAALTLPAPGAAGSLGANKALVIDGVAPSLTADTVPADATYSAGQQLDFTVTYSEAVTVNTGGGTPYIALTLDTGGSVQAAYVSGSGTDTLTFRYTVAAGNQDTNGISAAPAITLNGGTVRDAAGNNAAATGITFASTAGVLVDAAAPTVNTINRVGSASTNATSVDYTVTFSESVMGVDTSDFTVTGVGATGTVASIIGSGSTYTVTVNGITGTGTLRLDLNNAGTGIIDAPGNAIATGFTSGQTYTIDTVAPPAPSITALDPASDTGSSNSDLLTADTTPTLTGTAEANATVRLYDTDGTTVLDTAAADGAGNWSLTSSVLSAGAHTLTVKATDAAGNVSTASSGLVVTIDASAPAAPAAPDMVAGSDSGASSTDNTTSDTTPTVSGTAEAGSTVTLYDTDGTTVLDTAAADGAGVWSLTSSVLSSGAHTLTVKAMDAAGNVSVASAGLVVTIDTSVAAPSAPDLVVGSDSGTSSTDDLTNVTTPTVSGTAEAGSTVTLYDTDGTTVLGSMAADGAGNWSITTSTALSAGAHTLTAKAVDLAGNVSVASAGLSLTIDTTAPAASSPPNLDAASDTGASNTDNITAVTTPTFTGTAGLNANVTLYDTDGTSVLGSTVADGAGNWSITPGAALAAGAHTLTTKASDAAGNFSTASFGLSVTIDPTAPVLASATVNGSTLVLTYTDAGTLDAVNAAAPGAFTVMVGATPNVVTAAVVNAAAKTVTLTLTTAVTNGQVVTVAYADPTGGDDASAVQDAAGNDAATLAATAVTNNTAAPDPGPGPTPPITPIDGVPVVTEPGPGGSTIITIPVVVPTRPDTPGTPSPLADIPLVTSPSGTPIVSVGVPTGVGLQAEGLTTTTTGSAALAELGFRIERIAGDSPELTNAGQVFYATLAPNEPLSVQILKPTIGVGYDGTQPLVITGSNNPADGKQAVIVDARSLPSGTVIQVDDVEFLAVVGAVRIIGGAGQNAASGDSANQWIVLGPDDDTIHGGGGNDTVGSEGGDDQVYGDAGDDIVFGGAGNDLLSGGTGSDKLNGGTGFDVAIQEGARSDYTVTLEGAGIKLTHTASGVSDWLVDVEQVRFATGPSLTVAHSAAEEAGAYLFQKWVGRDLNQGEGAIIQSLTGKTALEVATLFAQFFPEQSGGRTPAQLLEGMASAGAVRVDAIRDVTVTGDAGHNTINPTLGLARYVDGGAGTDTVVIPATLGQTHVQANGNGSFTLQRLTDGAMLDTTRVERVTFSDTKLALDLDGNAGQAAKLLGALGGPGMLANKGVVGEVIRLLDAGATSETIAGLGLQLLGANTPTQIAQTLWTNVVGRAGTDGELKLLTDLMAGGVSAGELVVMAANLEMNATRIDLVGLTAKGIEFA